MTRPWTILQHVAWEGPGLIAAEAKAHGLLIETRRLDRAARIPEPDEVESLIGMGGPMGAYETDKQAFLVAECKLIAEVVRRNRPVLGVCLGAQLLAKALRARVFPGHASEIGFGSVRPSQEGESDPVLGPAGPAIPVFHWHGDTFDLPEGATLLASNMEYLHQAFRFGICAYGMQFHIEPDSAVWSSRHEHLPPGRIEGTEQARLAIERVGRDLITRFFDLALGQRLGHQNRIPSPPG